MSTKLRIGTWNLDHASNSSRPIAAQIEQMRKIDADIWVLTETCEKVDLSEDGYVSITPHSKNIYDKYWSTIWSRWGNFHQIDCYDNETAVCAQITTPLGNLIIYGTIITYHGYKGPQGDSPAWAEHERAIACHGNDWRSIQDKYAGIPFFVAGDFNQTRDGSVKTYGTKLGRELLGEELRKNHLTCLTTENFGSSGKLKVDPSKGWARNNIDHICMTDGAFQQSYVGAWDHFTESAIYLSDHNGVYVDVER